MVKLVVDRKENLAYCQASEKIHHDLTMNARSFNKGIYEVVENFSYVAVGYALANITFFIGNTSLIVVDCTEAKEAAEEIMTDMRTICDKPVKTIIFTHHHPDHHGGVKGIINEDDEVEIIAQEKFMDGIRSNASLTAPWLNQAAVASFGLVLPKSEDGVVSNGIGPTFYKGVITLIKPTTTFDKILKRNIDGIDFVIWHAPSECEDELNIYLPEYGLLQVADTLMGNCLANGHTIRGCKFRDIEQWAGAIKELIKYNANHVIGSHGLPMSGKEQIERMLYAQMDGFLYILQQGIRHINMGYSPEQMQHMIKLPDHIANHPWMKPYYGTTEHIVRQLRYGLIGFFDGDPTTLNPTPKTTISKIIIDGMGGIDEVLRMVTRHMSDREYQIASELLTYVLDFEPYDEDARELKAVCLTELAYLTMNTNWRNWYLTSAMELRGEIDFDQIKAMHGLNATDVINEIPTKMFVQSLLVRIDPEKCYDVHYRFAFFTTDDDLRDESQYDKHVVEIRRGVGDYHSGGDHNKGIKIKNCTLRSLFTKRTTLEECLKGGEIRLLKGSTLMDIKRFFTHFDLRDNIPPLTIRPS